MLTQRINAWIFAALVIMTTCHTFGQQVSATSPVAGKWEKELNAFIAHDKANPSQKGGVVFTGSSSIRMWTNLAQAFPRLQPLNRGFGGSQFSDVVEHLDLLVLKHKPHKVVFYSGDNDIAAGKAPADILRDCEKLVARIGQNLPETQIYFISPKPSPSRWHLRENMEQFNQGLEALCSRSKNATFIDVYQPMLDAHGKPDPSLFLKDNLHLNGKGYELWARVVGPHLVEKEQENR